MWISSWARYTQGLRQIISRALADGRVEATDDVWLGPSGDAFVETDGSDVTDEHGDYVDAGQVGEYID